MKKKQQALFQSAIALLLCVSMLIGTTFAWFTDQVSSLNNIITAGNLDVELEYLDDNGNWKTVNNSSEIFDPNTLWEPGHTEVAYLRVSNLGTLALKYQLGVNIASETGSTNVNGKEFKLSDYIYFGAVEGVQTAFPSRQAARAAVNSRTLISKGYTKPGAIEAGAPAHYVAIVVYMPEEVGNEANYAKGYAAPKIELGINVIATQYTSENDSFGKDYDDNAKFPEVDLTTGITVPVTPDANGKVPSELTIASTSAPVFATVPAGVQLEAGTASMTLSVSEMTKGNVDIPLGVNEIKRSLDVHISGVAASNTVPMLITVPKAMMTGLNMGNYKLYHVENGTPVQMTYVASAAELDAHNEFTYDPVTGDVTMALASFSEVALVAEEAKWKGNFDYSWYVDKSSPYTIANADQLAGFGAIVGGMNGQKQDSFSGKTIKLVSDINLGDKENENNPDIIFYPIGYNSDDGKYEKTGVAVTTGFYAFKGTFDGNGHTIANFYQNTWEMKGDHNWYTPEEQYYRDGMGLFGKVYGGIVKNLTVDNFSSDGEIATTGVIAAYADFGAEFSNIAITNCNPRVYNIGNGGIVGCVGWYTADETDKKVTFTNITVDNTNKISALWGSYDVACGGIVGQYYPTSGQTSAGSPKNAGIDFKNCHVSAQMDVYNDVCANYQYYAYRYTGMLIGSVRENVTIDGHVYPKMDGITASGCTVHFGTWNDYYYCEIIDNTTASYTHDYQMSRLTEIKAIDGTTITYLDGTTGTVPASGRANYVIVDYTKGHGTENATCYHFKDGAVWTHDMGGIQTGIDEDGDGQDDLKEDKQHIYLEFNNLVTGYGWGVTSRGFSNLDGVTNLDITQGNQEASVEKFEDAGYAPKDYKAGEIIRIGDLFKAKNGVTINTNSVYVSVSPVIEGDKVSATFALDEDDWRNSTITFAEDSKGTAKISITDYIFCTPTVIYLNEEAAVEKFTVNNVSAQNAYTQITLGTLFGAKNGATIGNVTATVTDPNGNKTTVTVTSSDWATKTVDLVKEGTWTVSIADDDKYCAATVTKFTVNKVDKFTKKFTQNFLYRVGNQNTVAVGSIFGEIETAVQLSSVNVTITNVAGNASGDYTSNATWTNGNIQFSDTGVVKVTISADGANPVEINLEVVDATNITSATGTTTGGNLVLLCDVNTSTYVNYWNCTLYGNGFKYSLNGAPTTYNSKQGKGILITQNAILDNLVIVGDVYNDYGAYIQNEYYNTVIDVTGDTIIQNCYISGCAAPVRARNNVTITNSTLYGGAVGNLIIESGTVTLEDVTTANYDDGRAIVGMGIVVHSDATEAAKLVLNGTLTQYNFISESKEPTDTYAKNLHTTMFGDSCSKYHFGTAPNRYVNAGIVSLTSLFNAEDITDNANTGYVGTAVTVSGFNGYVYTQPKTSGSVNNGYDKENDPHVSTTQGAVPPSYSFDYTNKNYVAKTDGSNDYCYAENGKVNISMDKGDTFNWDTSILTIGKDITNYTVSMNGTDYTGKSIAFNTAGDYEVVYTYTDDKNYGIDENGNITTYSKTYTKTVNITVAVVEAATKHAEFTFGSSNTASTTVTVGNSTYVMPNVSATSSTIGSTTVSGQTIYYPIVEIIMSDGKTSHTSGWYAYFPVFSGAVTITDYADNGVGDAMTPYDETTTTMPNGLSVVGDAKTLFKYQSGSNAGETPVVKNNMLVYSSAKIEAKRSEYNTVVQYSYTDNAGATYYYYIGYHAPAQSYTSCVTGDTLVTLADGTQKRIDALTGNEMLLVWNHETGSFDVAPVAYIVDHEGYVSENAITHLYFSNGYEIKIIGEHVFFDNSLNKYVAVTSENADSFIGHSFAVKADDLFTSANLVKVDCYNEVTRIYEVVSYKNITCFTNNILSASAYMDQLLNIFDVNPDTMAYNAEDVQKDIETYGLYTYADFEGLIEEEAFELYNAKYLKIAVGKGYITWDDILALIDIYFGVDVQPIQ